MSIRVNREALLNALESVEPGIAPRETVTYGTCFLFKDGEISTYNDEVSCRIPSPLGKKITGAVKSEKLLEVLRRLTEEELIAEATEGELVLIGKGRRSGFAMEVIDEIPPSDAVEKPGKWTKLHEDFADAVALVQQCAGKDESQYHLVCVHITPKWVEACDNFQLCRWRLPTGFSAPMLVKQSSIKHISSLGMTEFSETESWVHFKSPHGLVLSCRRLLDDYINASPMLKVEGRPIALPKGLAESCSRAEIFSAENQDSNRVLVDLKAGRLKVKGQGISGWHQESKKIRYDGEAMSFFVAPGVLADLVKRHSECVISSDRLKADGGSYTYVAWLAKPEDAADKDYESNGSSEEEERPARKKKQKAAVGEED